MTSLILPFSLLMALSRAQPENLINHKNTYNEQHKGTYVRDIVIIVIGLILIIAQILVYRHQKKQGALIPFSVFHKGLQEHSSQTQSHNDFSVEKNEVVNNNQNAPSKDDSPGIKTIKAMTGNNQEQKQSKKKRKRKADKLSDRRSKQETDD